MGFVSLKVLSKVGGMEYDWEQLRMEAGRAKLGETR